MLVVLITRTEGGSDTIIMTEAVSDEGDKPSCARAEERADEIRKALGLLARFVVHTSAGVVLTEVWATDIANAMLRLCRGKLDVFKNAADVVIRRPV